MKISFLTSGHDYKDDRIFYHQAKSLVNAGNQVEIITSKTDLKEVCKGILLNGFAGDADTKKNKVNRFVQFLKISNPDVLICSEPLVVLAASRYKSFSSKKVRILYDITEWYPSKRNLPSGNPFVNAFTFIKLLLFNVYASSMADGFIFGEWYKSKPYRFLFRNKPYLYLTYYPDLNYIHPSPPEFDGYRIRLCHSGKMTRENGYINFVQVVNLLADKMPGLLIDVKVIGWYETEKDQVEGKLYPFREAKNLKVTFYPKQSYEQYIKLIQSIDLFMDLRSNGYENQRSLPIKLFYYLALGRPVIYSDLKSIRKEVEIDQFGFLVDPDNSGQIVEIIKGYIQDPELYKRHCKNAMSYSSTKYNWKQLEPSFLNFIQLK